MITETELARTAARILGRSGGLKGGKARAAKLTPEQRAQSARNAAIARWAMRQKIENVPTETVVIDPVTGATIHLERPLSARSLREKLRTLER
jgi:hypothetical protein